MSLPLYLLACEGENPRRAYAIGEVRRVFGRNPIVFAGIHKDAPDFQRRACAVAPRFVGSAGHIACATGHQRMLSAFLVSGKPFALFLEDDVRFLGGADEFTAAFEELESIDPEWDWVKFKAPFADLPEDRMEPHRSGPAGMHVTRAARLPWTTICYGASLKGAARLLAKTIPLIADWDASTTLPGPGDHAYAGRNLIDGAWQFPSLILNQPTP